MERVSTEAVTGHTTEAIQRWADEIAALGGGEPLTRFRDAKSGTLDLTSADESSRKKLLDGEPVRLSRLFPHDPVRAAATRSAGRLAERLTTLEAGHGIAAGYLATGLASWNDPASTRRPNVPILLRRLQVESTGFADADLMLHVVGEAELNPRLLDAMAAQLGLRVTPADLLDPAGQLRYPVVVERLREQAPAHVVDGFTITHRAVIGLMTSVAQDVAADLTTHAAQLARRPLVALAAGTARPNVPAAAPGASATDGTATPIDLDSVQRGVLDAVRAGSSVAVEAPAGTGATQVAAGLCAEAVAAGRSVLVVAESSPRLRGLRRRLAAIGLGSATLDLADGLISTTGLARDVLSTLDAAERQSTVGTTATPGLDVRQAEADRSLLTSYVTALHEHRSPHALSAYQAISAAHAGTAAQQTSVRLDAAALAGLDVDTMERLRAALREFIELDGLVISAQATAWFGAQPASRDDAEQAVALADRLRTQLLPQARDRAARAAAEVGMPSPATMDDLTSLAALLTDVARVEQVFTRELWSAPVARMAAAASDRQHRRTLAEPPGMRERRTLRQQARSVARPAAHDDAAAQAAALSTAEDVLQRWSARARDGRLPRTTETSVAATAAIGELTEALDALAEVHPQAIPEELDVDGVAARLSVLAAEAQWARRLPTLTAHATDLADSGLGPLVADLRQRREAGEQITAELAVGLLDTCVAASLAAQIESSDPVLSQTSGDEIRAASDRWRQADAAAVVSAADAARSSWSARVSGAAAQRPAQVRALRDVVGGSGAATVRELVAGSWQTLVTARPIWLGGPLPLAAALPVEQSFDLLVVLDAQAVALAHAAGALARAHQVVVLADSAQLPPTPTPLSVDAPDPRSVPPGPGGAIETPSVYAVLRDQLPTIDLVVRYGCRDARLESAMPARRGSTALAVPPGAAAASPVRFLHIEQEPGSRDQEESVSTEVDAVVDLVRAHVTGRPDASLAVLTVGRAHEQALRVALARACTADPTLADALGPHADEPFLLRCIEDLQGERRDALILSVGYGRTMDGRLLYRYGPLNRPGGTRWLAAGVSVARRDLVVVSSVTASDLEPRRLAADGLRALRQLLATAEGIPLNGLDDPAAHPALTPRSLDPLERSIAERLHAIGLPVLAGSGTSWLATAMAVGHPGRPGRGVLVVEPEGGAFARLRQLRDRERMRPEQLMRAGWSIQRVCVVDWLRDPEREVQRVEAAWRQACDLADTLDAAENTPASSADADEGAAAAVDQSATPGPRPAVAVGRPVDAYPEADLVALASWVGAAQPALAADEALTVLGAEIGLVHPTGRQESRLRRAWAAAQISRSPRRVAATSGTASPLAVADPVPLLSAADEAEASQERSGDDEVREAWLQAERPPHHGG